jgi:hypothetical protein
MNGERERKACREERERERRACVPTYDPRPMSALPERRRCRAHTVGRQRGFASLTGSASGGLQIVVRRDRSDLAEPEAVCKVYICTVYR